VGQSIENIRLVQASGQAHACRVHAPIEPLSAPPPFATPTRRLGPLGKTLLACILLSAAFIGVTTVRHVFFSPDWRLNGERQPRRIQVDQWQGASHCGWQDTTFLDYDGYSYVRDTGDRFGGTPVSYAEGIQLPASARDTGWRDGNRELWVAPDSARGPTSVYVVAGDLVERWPRFDTGCM
jgi:hypothetical protein